MRFSDLGSKIQILSSVSPSEDPEKVKTAILNIFPESKITNAEDFSICTETTDLRSLKKIRETVYSTQSQKALQRQLEKHMNKNSTWFYLNKQAAFVGRIALCEEADESPLGPLKIIITSTNMNRVIESLVSGDDR
jgi:predicted RNA binding protein with dsRBD fold (UPF0201 family)